MREEGEKDGKVEDVGGGHTIPDRPGGCIADPFFRREERGQYEGQLGLGRAADHVHQITRSYLFEVTETKSNQWVQHRSETQRHLVGNSMR